MVIKINTDHFPKQGQASSLEMAADFTVFKEDFEVYMVEQFR
jgi:hypothetical protein